MITVVSKELTKSEAERTTYAYVVRRKREVKHFLRHQRLKSKHNYILWRMCLYRFQNVLRVG